MSVSAPAVWSEIDHTFSKDASGDLKIARNVDAVKSSIANILGTRQCSRVMLPSFAETYTNFLFDPIDTHLATYLADRVKDVIEKWDDRVRVVSADFKSMADYNTVSMIVVFVIRGNPNVFSMEHNFSGV